MKKIGFDWGTTTTSICFFDEENNAYNYFHLGTSTQSYFPSIITYRLKKSGKTEIKIGDDAKERLYKPHLNYDTYDNLKLKLNASAMTEETRQRTAYEAARDFIGTALASYAYSHGGIIEEIVFTIPDSWGKDIFANPSLFLLEKILREVMPKDFDVETQVEFYSEPVAAAAYYCGSNNKNFEGYLLVVDVGGGTLDLTLCEVNDKSNRIVVLKRCGELGEGYAGCAGEAFDLEVTKRIVDAEKLGFVQNSIDFIKLKNFFEKGKINCAQAILKELKNYYAASDADKVENAETEALTFEDDNNEYTVYVKDIVEAFNDVNRPALEKCIDEILIYCTRHNINIRDNKNFRVIFTGGFSNLYCIEALVREKLGASLCGEDKRFSEGISLQARSTAIAHGAGVIAEGKMYIDILLQKDVGFFYFDIFDQEEKNVTLLRAGDCVKNLREPVYFKRQIYGTDLKKDSVLKIFVVENETKSVIITSLNDLCEAGSNKIYKFGLSLSRRGELILHSLDDIDTHRQIAVGL